MRTALFRTTLIQDHLLKEARVTQGVHPERLAVPGISGRWGVGLTSARHKGIHFNSLLTQTVERMDTVAAALDSCVKVKVTKGG